MAARGSVCAGQCSDRAGAAFDCFGGSAATDFDFERVQGVIAHEYFHNWTGNRVTCRDWFQLTLKEGLTVFRDRQVCAKARLRRAASVHAFAAFQRRFAVAAAGRRGHVPCTSYLEALCSEEMM